MLVLGIRELDFIVQFRDLSMVCILTPGSVMLCMLKVNNEFLNEIRENKKPYVKLVDLLSSVNLNKESEFKVDEIGVLRFRGRVYVPGNSRLKNMILEESYKISLNIHSEAT